MQSATHRQMHDQVVEGFWLRHDISIQRHYVADLVCDVTDTRKVLQ